MATAPNRFGLDLRVNPDSLLELEAMFGKNSRTVEQATYAAIRRTLQTGRAWLTREYQAQLGLRPIAIRSRLSSRMAGGNAPLGTISILGDKPISLIEYKPRATKAGVVVKMSKDRPAVMLRHAFIQTLQGIWGDNEQGRRHVVTRGQTLPTRGPNVYRARYTSRKTRRVLNAWERRHVGWTDAMPAGQTEVFGVPRKGGGLTPRGYAAKWSVTKMSGATLTGVFGEQTLTSFGSKALEGLQAELDKNLASQVDRFLNRKKIERPT